MTSDLLLQTALSGVAVLLSYFVLHETIQVRVTELKGQRLTDILA